jgi:DNA-directed RNA polymerase subunit RPC12/RpoP
VPPTPTISFICQQCGKKFSAPASAAGRSVTCKCGAQVAISATPPPQSFSTPTASQQPATLSTNPTIPANNSAWQPSTPTGSGSYGASGLPSSRRTFPALDAVAKVFVVLAWLYAVFGILGGLFLLIAASQVGRAEAIGAALGGCILLALGVGLAFIFFRAFAEMIRLGLYIAELLEDIRAK